jgi:hypothetical protein
VELAKLKGEGKILQGLVDKLQGALFVTIGLLSFFVNELCGTNLIFVLGLFFYLEIRLSICAEQKKLIEKAEEEERLKKEKEEKRIKEEAEKQAAHENKAPDASQQVDSKETNEHVEEDESKVGIPVLRFCCLPVTFVD